MSKSVFASLLALFAARFEAPRLIAPTRNSGRGRGGNKNAKSSFKQNKRRGL